MYRAVESSPSDFVRYPLAEGGFAVRRLLTAHPDFPSQAVCCVEIEIAQAAPGAASLTYIVTGDIGAVVLPAPAPARRTDELWRATCFEAFLRPEPGEAYLEFNFAPSTQWAAYRFNGYRAGMAPLDIPPLDIDVHRDAKRLELRVAIPAAAPSRLAVSAILEEAGGRKSYWALAHPPGRPDFHHAAGFVASPPP
jgi:hypothetical protein